MKCPYCDGSGDLPAPTVGALVLFQRRKAGLTQLELADAARLSRGQIANLETDRTDIPLKTLIRVAEALHCSVKELVP